MKKNFEEEKALLAQRHQLKNSSERLDELKDKTMELKSNMENQLTDIEDADAQIDDLFKQLDIDREDVTSDFDSTVIDLSDEEMMDAKKELQEYIDIPKIPEMDEWHDYQEHVNEYLLENNLNYTPEHQEALFIECRDAVIDAVINSFGLSKQLFEDKDGGNVTTTKNAKSGIYARENQKYSEEMRKKYAYKNSADNYKSQREEPNNIFTDEYTGKKIPSFKAEVDHIFPLEKFHRNGGFMLNDERKSRFASDQRNFSITDKSLNASKKALDFDKFLISQSNGRSEDNKQFYNIDKRRTNSRQKKAKKVAKEYLPSNKQKFEYYSKEITATGFKEAKNMGKQQAIGLIYREIVITFFDEIKDIYQNGLKKGNVESSFFEVMTDRLTKAAKRVLARWRNVINSFKDGAVSGFLSNMVTTIINIFLKTGKRVVRMIREGAFSLFKAIKMLINPPQDMTLKQAAHESSKLLASSLTISVGIMIEEAVENFINKWIGPFPFLNNFTDSFTSIIVGTVTGLTTVLLVNLLDKLDLFNVHSQDEYEYILNQLESL
ncbi:hypothetical protein [Salibacterium lacus]|uniref:HNH endonuclease n=1 Tax=Salibacterium lacus TaxID=1898109 RepID=A0ABW5T4N2_9BACI